jgi:hypothetical protein
MLLTTRCPAHHRRFEIWQGETKRSDVYRLDLEAGWADVYMRNEEGRSLRIGLRTLLQRVVADGFIAKDLHPEWGEVPEASPEERELPPDLVLATP